MTRLLTLAGLAGLLLIAPLASAEPGDAAASIPPPVYEQCSPCPDPLEEGQECILVVTGKPTAVPGPSSDCHRCPHTGCDPILRDSIQPPAVGDLAVASAGLPPPPVQYGCVPCPEPSYNQQCSVVVGGVPVPDPLAPSCDCDYGCANTSLVRELLKGAI
jgi:hypothetical protein